MILSSSGRASLVDPADERVISPDAVRISNPKATSSLLIERRGNRAGVLAPVWRGEQAGQGDGLGVGDGLDACLPRAGNLGCCVAIEGAEACSPPFIEFDVLAVVIPGKDDLVGGGDR